MCYFHEPRMCLRDLMPPCKRAKRNDLILQWFEGNQTSSSQQHEVNRNATCSQNLKPKAEPEIYEVIIVAKITLSVGM